MELKFLPEVTNFKCINCKQIYHIDSKFLLCETCGGLLEVIHDWSMLQTKKDLLKYQDLPSGVWKYKPLIYPNIPKSQLIMRGEGLTGLYKGSEKISSYAGSKRIYFKHEGENPTGSFKDRGMCVGITEAKRQQAKGVICASTGNTSASLAAYAAFVGLRAVVIIPKGKIASGKLAQAIAYGAEVFQIEGNFDDSLKLVQTVSERDQLYLLNSINPWRIEGQKSIIFEMLEQRNWVVPDWIVVPAGNLGNTSAFGKALKEAYEIGLIDDIPRLISVQATGAQPFVQYWNSDNFIPDSNPETLATAIQIGNPISYKKAYEALKFTKGLAITCSDQDMLDAKAIIDSAGIGCEPASASTLAGIKYLIESGKILPSETIIAILTGHILKDPKIILDYHQDKLPIISNYRNKIKSIKRLE